MRLKIALISIILNAATIQVSMADVYRYVDDGGVICFTDCPKKKGAVRILRERKKPAPHASMAQKHFVKEPAKRSGLGKYLSERMELPVNGRISSVVGLRHDPIDGLMRFHNGIDIAVPEGTPVKPVAPGTVYFSGTSNGYGNMVILSHEDGMITIYAHNSLNLVKEGERAGKNTAIAMSGSTGRSTGPHLHFEAWKNGSNITDAFLGRIPDSSSATVVARPRVDIIRTSIRPDGSILFTNLP